MWSHARRLILDLARLRVWLIAVVTTTTLVSAILTYTMAFTAEAARDGALSTTPPQEPLSFLRVVDPRSSIVSSSNERSTLDTPGMKLLLDRMSRRSEIFMAIPLQAFTADTRRFSNMVNRGLVIVGAPPPFLDHAAITGKQIVLLGSIAGQVPEVDDSRIGEHAVHQEATQPPAFSYVAGSGRVASSGIEPIVLMSPASARDVGIYPPFDATRIASTVTCYCSATTLSAVAEEMTRMEELAGADRVYYATSYGGLIGPVERSWAASQVINLALPACALLSVLVLVVAAARLVWSRRVHAYQVEWLCGAGELGLQVRQQIIILVALTTPLATGFVAIDTVLRISGSPPPWPAGGGTLLAVGVVGVQVLAGFDIAQRVRTLFRGTRKATS